MAKRFQFKLAVLQRVRRRVQDAHRLAVARQAANVADATQRVAAVDQRLADSTQRIRQLMNAWEDHGGQTASGARFDIDAVRQHRLHYSQQMRIRSMAASALQSQVEKLQREQAGLAEATKAVRILDRLESRRREAYALEVSRAERVVEDEMAANLARRRWSGDAFDAVPLVDLSV